MRYLMSIFMFVLVAQVSSAEEIQEMPPVEEGTVPEQRLYIRPDNKVQVEEVQRGGQTMLLVRPSKGRPYYLVDTNGDGIFDSVQWVLFSW